MLPSAVDLLESLALALVWLQQDYHDPGCLVIVTMLTGCGCQVLCSTEGAPPHAYLRTAPCCIAEGSMQCGKKKC